MSETLNSETPSASSAIRQTCNERQELWVDFAKAQTLEHFCQSWLKLLASMGGSERQFLLAGLSQDEIYRPLALWPEGGRQTEALADVVEQAVDEKCGLVLDLEDAGGGHYAIAYPVHVDDQLQFVIAAEIETFDEAVLSGSMERLQWGSAWLEAIARRLSGQESRWEMERISLATDLLAQVLDEDRFDDAAMVFVTELAHQVDCDRVSLGLKKGGHVRVQALSHSAQFGERMNLIRAIGSAMDEAVLQNHDLIYPQHDSGPETLITRNHEHLVKTFSSTSVLTIPLFSGKHYYGAITLERARDTAFTKQEIRMIRELAALAGAALYEKWKNDRALIIKMRDALSRQLKRLFGPKYIGRKLTVCGLLLLILCCVMVEGDYRLSADTVLEGEVQRMVVAPYNGYIVETGARAGDVVDEGEILCRLDDRDLRLERLNWLSQQSQLQKQRQEAQAGHERAQVNILTAQLEQADAQLQLINAKLERTLLKSPYPGLVTSGDLSQRLGGAVQQGEVLFEIAPLKKYRVILKVDEKRITDVQVGQAGELVLTAIPDEHFTFQVSKITPITIAEEGANYFRIEAQLVETFDSLRPGMEGVGKIMVDKRNLFGAWTRNLREWLTLWVWSWWP